MRRTFSEWLSDWSHWAGYSNDPAEVDSRTVWLKFPGLYLSLYWPKLRGSEDDD